MEKRLIQIFVFLIQLYKKCISPALGPHCRFYPSCSQYSVEALQKYGIAKGVLKTTVRVCKCHPFHPGGIDLP